MFETITYVGRFIYDKTSALLFATPSTMVAVDAEVGASQESVAPRVTTWSWSGVAKKTALFGGGLLVGATVLGFGVVSLSSPGSYGLSRNSARRDRFGGDHEGLSNLASWLPNQVHTDFDLAPTTLPKWLDDSSSSSSKDVNYYWKILSAEYGSDDEVGEEAPQYGMDMANVRATGQSVGADEDFSSSEEVAPALEQLFEERQAKATAEQEVQARATSGDLVSNSTTIRPLTDEIPFGFFNSSVSQTEYPKMRAIYLPKKDQYLLMWRATNTSEHYALFDINTKPGNVTEKVLFNDEGLASSADVLAAILPNEDLLLVSNSNEFGYGSQSEYPYSLMPQGTAILLETRNQESLILTGKRKFLGINPGNCKFDVRLLSTKVGFILAWYESSTNCSINDRDIFFLQGFYTNMTETTSAPFFDSSYCSAIRPITLTKNSAGAILSYRTPYCALVYQQFNELGNSTVNGKITSKIIYGHGFYNRLYLGGLGQAALTEYIEAFIDADESGNARIYSFNVPANESGLLSDRISGFELPRSINSFGMISLHGDYPGIIIAFDYNILMKRGSNDYPMNAIQLDVDLKPVTEVVSLSSSMNSFKHFQALAAGPNGTFFSAWLDSPGYLTNDGRLVARIFAAAQPSLASSGAVLQQSSLSSSSDAQKSSAHIIEENSDKPANSVLPIAVGAGVGGGVLVVAPIVALGIFCNRRRRQRKDAFKERDIARLSTDIPMAGVSVLNTIQTENGEIKLGKCLGQGAFGKVFIGSWGTYGNVAIKQLDLQNTEFNPTLLDDYVREAKTMERLQHPNIVQYYKCFRDPGNQYFYIGIECMRGGSLTKYIEVNHSKQNLEGYLIGLLPLLINAAAGLAYLHDNGIIHRDIKPDNVLLNTDNVAKISDFGTAKITNAIDDQTRKQTKGMGTPIYMAPETLTPKPQYSQLSDVYSFGITILQTVTGEEPYRTWGTDYIKRILDGEREVIPGNVPCELADLIRVCTAQDRDARPEMCVVLQKLQDIQTKPSFDCQFGAEHECMQVPSANM